MTRSATPKRLWLIALAASVVLWACGGSNGGAMSGMDHGDAPSARANIDPPCSPQGTAVAVSTQDSKFDTSCLAVPAGQAFTIAFDNEEPVVHNVVILSSRAANEVLFRGELFRGPATKTYQVPALDRGTYVFHCETHQGAMVGTFVVS